MKKEKTLLLFQNKTAVSPSSLSGGGNRAIETQECTFGEKKEKDRGDPGE